MKVIVLGAGVGSSNYPGAINKYPPGYLIESNGELFMLECSEGIRTRIEEAGYDIGDISNIAISHSHPDHYALVQYYQSLFCNKLWGGNSPEELRIFCPDSLADSFEALWSIYNPDLEGSLFDNPVLDFYSMSHEGASQVGETGFNIYSKKVYHNFGKCDSLAFLVETSDLSIAYSGDTGECEGIYEIASGADIFICECSARIGDFYASKNYGHLTPFQAGKIAKEKNIKVLILTHFTGLDSQEEIESDCKKSGYKGHIIVARDGREYDFSSLIL